MLRGANLILLLLLSTASWCEDDARKDAVSPLAGFIRAYMDDNILHYVTIYSCHNQKSRATFLAASELSKALLPVASKEVLTNDTKERSLRPNFSQVYLFTDPCESVDDLNLAFGNAKASDHFIFHVSHRQILESNRLDSLFIGLTLGGLPIVFRLVKPLDVAAIWSACVAFVAMAIIAWLKFTNTDGGEQTGWLLLLIAGLCGASAMILPGLSGGYILLLLGQCDRTPQCNPDRYGRSGLWGHGLPW